MSLSTSERLLRSFVATLVVSSFVHQPAAAATQDYDELFRGLTPFGYAIYLSESGMHKQVVNKINTLLTELDKTHSPQKPSQITRSSGSTAALPIPLLRTGVKCGDLYRQLYAEALELKALSQFMLKQTAPAVSDLKKAISICPNHPYIHFSLANIYLKAKKNNEAILELNLALKLNKNLREAYFARASGYQQIGKRKESQLDLATARKLMSEQQEKLDSLTARIDKLVEENKTKEAIVLDRQMLSAFPRDVFAITGFADRLARSGQYKDALNYATCAISLDPANAYGYRIRANIHSRLDQAELELQDANKAFTLEPRSIETLNTRALANLDMDRPAQAIRDLDLLLKRKPEFADAYIIRSTANLRLAQFDKSIKDARMAVSLAPTSTYGYQSLGAALRRAGNFSEAQKTLEQSLKYSASASSDSIAMAQLNLAAVLTELKDAKANEHLDIAIKMAPGLAKVLLERGTYDGGQGKTDEALKILTKPTSRNNTSKVSKLSFNKGKGSALIRPKKQSPPSTTISASPEKSIRISKTDLLDCVMVTSEMIKGASEKPDPYYIRGTARLCLAQFKTAAEDFKKFAQLSAPNKAPSQHALVLAYLCLERIGKIDDAKSCLTLAAGQTARTAGSGSIVEARYFLNEAPEREVVSKERSLLDQTSAHCYLGMHFNTLASVNNARTHLLWVLNNGQIAGNGIVIAAAELSRLKLPKGKETGN